MSASRRKGVTLFTLLLAGYAISINRQWGINDVLITTVSAERTRPELESIIGNFIADMPICVSIASEATVDDIVEQTSQKLIEARINCDVPIRVMVEELGLASETLPTGALLNYSDFKVGGSISMKDIEVAPLTILDPNRYSSDSIKLFLFRDSVSIHGGVYYDRALYQQETIETLINYYKDSLRILSDKSKADTALSECFVVGSSW